MEAYNQYTQAFLIFIYRTFVFKLQGLLFDELIPSIPVTITQIQNMKTISTLFFAVSLLPLSVTVQGQLFANRSLSNLSTTAINMSLVPKINNTLSLGAANQKWKNIYTHAVTFADGSVQTKAFLPYAAGAGINISGNVISNAVAASPWITGDGSVFCTGSNIGIGINTPTARLEVAGGDARINGLTIGTGGGALASNIAVGQQALYNNISGFSNTAYGSKALFSNSSGYDNAAIGDNALYSNIDGLENTAVGNGTLYYNVSGYGNTATGNGALLNNGAVPNALAAPEGSYNAATGFFALFNNSTGSYNAGFGTASLNANTAGSYNTSAGAFSDVSAEDLVNATAIGANSLVNSSNKIRLGDVNVTVVESAAGSWTTSDGRFKTNIREDVVGLPFITLLRPVVYNFDAAKFDAFLSQSLPDSVKAKRKQAMKKLNSHSKISGMVQTGFIAQEVAAAAGKAGYNFNGVHVAESSTDNYSLSYEKLVVPLVKSVQELAQQNEDMKNEIALLKGAISLLQQKNNTQAVTLTGALLQQNTPNPSAGKTTIQYSLPKNSVTGTGGQLIITDLQGKNIKQIALSTQQQGTVVLDTSNLAAGTYQYSLYSNGVLEDTKQMLITK